MCIRDSYYDKRGAPKRTSGNRKHRNFRNWRNNRARHRKDHQKSGNSRFRRNGKDRSGHSGYYDL